MRKTTLITAVIFAILGIVFAILPLGTLALIPIVISLLFASIAFIKSEDAEKKLPKWLLLISGLTLIVVIGKETLIKDEVAKDVQFEQKKEASKKEDLKDLEGL